MTLNGMFTEPKPHRINFIKENKKKLKQLSSLVNQNDKSGKLALVKSLSSQTDVDKLTSNSSSKLNTTPSSSGRLNRKTSASVFARDGRINDISSVTALFSSKKSSLKSVSAIKHQSCQTIDPKNYDQLFHEGSILYPSSKVLEEIAEAEKQKANRLDAYVKKDFFKKNKINNKSPSKTTNKVNVPEAKKGSDENTIVKSENEENRMGSKKESDGKFVNKAKAKDMVALNAADIIKKTTEDHLSYSPRAIHTTTTNSLPDRTLPSNRGDSNTSSIPKISKSYTTKRNKVEDEVLKTVLDPMCPPGHIPLPDQERKKTLHMLRVSYAELIREMNLLPVRTDTLRIRQRKLQLETQLGKIEEGIKVFNKSKVYVKIEE